MAVLVNLGKCSAFSVYIRRILRGIHDLRMDGGLPPGFQKATPLKLPTVAVIPTFRMNFGGKLPILDNFLPISGKPSHV